MPNLDNLAQLIMLANQQNQPQGVETANIGGNNIIVNRKRNPISQGLNALTSLASGYTANNQLQKQFQFKQELVNILQNEQDPKKQIQGIMAIGAKYGGFGNMDKQIQQYVQALGKQIPQPKGTTKSGGLSPTLQKAKDTRTEKLITTLEDNVVKRDMISEASQALDNIDSGIYGKVKKGMLKNLSPDNPMLGDWQKIKMVLTDAQLLNTAKTKGAISDAEMALFADAAANNDLVSSPAVKVVFNKLTRFIDAEEAAQKKAYKKIYDEDPDEWGIGGGKTNIPASSPKTDKYSIGQTISKNGKTYKYIGNNQWSF